MSAFERTSLVMLICSRISDLRLDMQRIIKQQPRLMLIKGDQP
jgi:hypothetical protein